MVMRASAIGVLLWTGISCWFAVLIRQFGMSWERSLVVSMSVLFEVELGECEFVEW